MIRESYKTKALALAKNLGVEIEAGNRERTVEAKPGTHWAWNGVHELVSTRMDTLTMADCWRDLYIRMNDGLEKCGQSQDCLAWWDGVATS